MDGMIFEKTIRYSISVVSHAQIDFVVRLLGDIETYCKHSQCELILTLNLDETLPFSLDSFSYPITVIRNATPMGFAANHNQAFRYSNGPWFCVMNPDIRLNSDPFPSLLMCLEDSSIGVAAPLVLDGYGKVEDSARCFPEPLRILRKLSGGAKGGDYVIGDELIYPDWAGGMFLLFPRNIFGELSGFDPRYYLYYEDVDICARLKLLGYKVVLCPKTKVIHYAQRNSHREFKYFCWHVRSMFRFFLSSIYWRLKAHK